ncbi:hypothetical protein PVK06_044005 [Gossypium arboreum]|uniref:Uncharacterized protein n=1 Tax=Gossypium arboreum TaxID=29729 RepID=A0ABR0MQE3_GOSAR|nr:hypothetical protein PVK06_044005 [Gossypium arboreum]
MNTTIRANFPLEPFFCLEIKLNDLTYQSPDFLQNHAICKDNQKDQNLLDPFREIDCINGRLCDVALNKLRSLSQPDSGSPWLITMSFQDKLGVGVGSTVMSQFLFESKSLNWTFLVFRSVELSLPPSLVITQRI